MHPLISVEQLSTHGLGEVSLQASGCLQASALSACTWCAIDVILHKVVAYMDVPGAAGCWASLGCEHYGAQVVQEKIGWANYISLASKKVSGPDWSSERIRKSHELRFFRALLASTASHPNEPHRNDHLIRMWCSTSKQKIVAKSSTSLLHSSTISSSLVSFKKRSTRSSLPAIRALILASWRQVIIKSSTCRYTVH